MSIIKQLSEIKNLPTLPEVVLRIQELIMSEEGNAALLARIIKQDPPLTAKILNVANSTFYCSADRKISSVSQAITRIGFNEIGHIALAVNYIRQFSHKSNVLDYHSFWIHALTSGYLCSLIAENNCSGLFSPADHHHLFVSGLLHDLGILVYDQFFHSYFERIIDQAVKKEIPFLVAEKDITPMELHGLIGSILLEQWKIDRRVVAAVRFHHAPDNASEQFRHYAFATYLSEYYLCNMILGSFEGSMVHNNSSALDELQMSHEIMVDLLQQAQAEVEHSDLLCAMDSTGSYSHLKNI